MSDPVYSTNHTVLVTGATGFVAGWLVKRLLEEGFTVHAAVRDPSTTQTKTAHLTALADKLPGQLKLFKADLLVDGSYSEAMKGCRVVFHTASPFTSKFSDPQRDLVDPAVNGTRNVLVTANHTPSVERVVLTSSCVSIFGDTIDVAAAPGGVLTEEIWNTTSSLTRQPYAFSKVEAEKAAWEIVKAQNQWKLVTINPSLVMGPTISGASTSESHRILRMYGDDTMKIGAPPFEIGMVDVRDVAEAHMRAGFVETAYGRYIVSAETVSFLQLGKILRGHFGDRWPFPTRALPKWLPWLVGPMINKSVTRDFISRNMGLPWRADNSKSKRELGLTYHPISSAVIEMFQQMIDTGAVKAR